MAVVVLGGLLLCGAGMLAGSNSPPILMCDNFAHGGCFEQPSYLSNGFFSVRPGPNPLLPQATTFVRGYTFLHPGTASTETTAIPYPFRVNVTVAGKAIDISKASVQRQQLNISSGELTTWLRITTDTVTPGNWTLLLTVVQLASRSQTSLAVQRITASIRPEHLPVEIKPAIVLDGVHGVRHFDTTPVQCPRAAALADLQQPNGPRSRRHRTAHSPNCSNWAYQGVNQSFALRSETTGTQLAMVVHAHLSNELSLPAHGVYAYEMLTSIVVDAYSPNPMRTAIMHLQAGVSIGVETLKNRSRELWADLWQARAVISGPGASATDQLMMDASLYHLLTTSHPSGMLGLDCGGISNAYGGATTWDVDSFQQPAIALLHAPSAAALAKFRARTLPAAQRNAALFGIAGAMFPWMAGHGTDLDGAATDNAPQSYAEQHISLDVANGIWEVALVLNDAGFTLEVAWPVLREVARYVAARGSWTQRGFEVLGMQGPDEVVLLDDNNSYFNLGAALVMRAAVYCARNRLPAGFTGVSESELKEWERIGKYIVLPFGHDKHGTTVVMPYDGLDPSNVNLKTGVYVLGNTEYLWLHGLPSDLVNNSVLRATFTLDNELRQTMSCPKNPYSVPTSSRAVAFTTPPFTAINAQMGNRTEALRLFRLMAEDYSQSPYFVVAEDNLRLYPGGNNGLYMTNYGSQYLGVALGMTGLRFGGINRSFTAKAEEWLVSNVSLPMGWDSIHFGRMTINGEQYSMVAEHGRRAKLSQLTR